jgi:hypothetical protein
MNPNYSHQTSLPAYKSNVSGKEIQKKVILKAMQSLGGKATLLQLAEITDIHQSTVSGRMSDLRKDRKVMDTGEKLKYGKYTRKLFAVIPETVPVSQATKPIATSFFE